MKLFKNISFIVQGPIIEKKTSEVLKSIRLNFPGSEIILSTWKNFVIDGLDYDIIVKNIDPGHLPSYQGKPNNLNRQIVSTLNGLKKAKTEFSVKIRTDTLIKNSNICKKWDEALLHPRPALFNVYGNRLLICSEFTWNPEKNFGLFHPSDLFMFGKTEDLLKLWNCPLAGIESPFVNTPEKYLFCNLLDRYIGRSVIELMRTNHYSAKNLWLSERSLFANYFLFSAKDLGLENERLFGGCHTSDFCYTAAEWEHFNRIYCNKKWPIGRATNVFSKGVMRKIQMTFKFLFGLA